MIIIVFKRFWNKKLSFPQIFPFFRFRHFSRNLTFKIKRNEKKTPDRKLNEWNFELWICHILHFNILNNWSIYFTYSRICKINLIKLIVHVLSKLISTYRLLHLQRWLVQIKSIFVCCCYWNYSLYIYARDHATNMCIWKTKFE